MLGRRALAGVLVVAAGSVACGAASAEPAVRTVRISIRHSAFGPDAVAVAPGQTVRFVLENTDPIDHEFIVGDASVQRAHEEGTESHHPPRPGEVSIPAGATVATTYTFGPAAGTLIYGCHLPGHYAYGMRGLVSIR